MHLIKLTPDQVSRHWILLRTAVEEAAPPTMRMSDAFVLETLKRLMSSQIQAWVMLEKIPDTKISGVCMTMLQANPLDGTKTLLVFLLYFFGSVPFEKIEECFETIRKYAKAEECRSLTFYTVNKAIVGMAQKLGFTTEYMYGVLDV